jgi:hypothetical protein
MQNCPSKQLENPKPLNKKTNYFHKGDKLSFWQITWFFCVKAKANLKTTFLFCQVKIEGKYHKTNYLFQWSKGWVFQILTSN